MHWGVLTLLLVLMTADAAIAAGCGSRGGPGYRGPDGRCVGWKALNKVCGSPPTTRCDYEGPAAESAPTSSQGLLSTPAQAAPGDGPVTTNVQVMRAEGMGCSSQDDSRKLQLVCGASAGPDCASAQAQAATSSRCVKIPAGAIVKIEAGSHSFDWLRVRISGHKQSLWVERGRVLDD